MTRTEFRGALTSYAMERAKEAHAESLALWRDLEGKARGNITLAGIFLAGAFGFVRDAAGSDRGEERSLLAGAVLMLASAILSAFVSLKTERVLNPPSGDHVEGMARDLLESPQEAEFAERLDNLRLDLARGWNVAARQLNEINERKAGRIWWSQFFLVISAVLVTGAVIARLV